MDRPLHGRVAVVEGAGVGIGAVISGRLAGAGARVDALGGDLESADGAAAAWDRLGVVDIYVHVGPWASIPERRPLVEIDDTVFASAFERPVLALLWSLRAGYAHLAKPGARVVVVVPTVGMAGAPGLAATAAAAEAQRQLAKSVARQWGREGVTVNIVAADLSALAPSARALPSVSLSPPALGVDAVRDTAALADLVAMLVSGGAPTLTGATLSADGGIWMAP